MKKILTIIAVSFLTSTAFSQYSETRTIKDFDELRVTGPFEVELIEDQNNQLIIESEEIDLHKIITEMDGSALKIRSAAAFTSQKTIHIKVHYDVIREITSSAGAIVFSNKPIYGDKINIRANTGGRIEFQIEMEKVELKATQGSNIYLEGKVKDLEINCTTGSSVHASELQATNVIVEASTGGLVEINVAKRLEAHASSKGSILYVGDPTTLIDDVKLKGSITKK